MSFVWLCKIKLWWKSKVMLVKQSFIAHIKTDDIYKDITENLETRFDTSNHDLDKPLLKRKNYKVIGRWTMTYVEKSWQSLFD